MPASGPRSRGARAHPCLSKATQPCCGQVRTLAWCSRPRRVAALPDEALASGDMSFEHVLVVGAGQMGGGIAQVVAVSGRRVSLHDAAPGAVERGLETMRRSLGKLAEKGGPDPDDVLGRVEPVDDLVPADLMIEAVVEDAAVKEDVFRRADETFPHEAILASNTSSIPISTLATPTHAPDPGAGLPAL